MNSLALDGGKDTTKTKLVTPAVYHALVASLRARGLMPPTGGRVVGMFAPKIVSSGKVDDPHPEVCVMCLAVRALIILAVRCYVC